jgi:hypothetical protein
VQVPGVAEAESEAIVVALCKDQDCRHKQSSLLKMLRASIQCSFALLVLSHGIKKRLWPIALRRWSCRRTTSSPTSVTAASLVQQVLVRSGVGAVVNPGCCFAWHRQSLVAIASYRC